MAIHYILDGYNIINKIPSFVEKSLESGRDSLIRLVQNNRLSGSLKNEITIVFDGQTGVGGTVHQHASVRVIFSYQESADEKIKKMVSDSSVKKAIVVVTDDREIQYYVRALGAKVSSVDDFLSRAHSLDNARNRASGAMPSKNISSNQENQINLEMEKIWLKGRQKKKG